MAGSVFFIILRRMRAPLITLIVIYAVSILGLVLIPGVDGAGRPTPPLSFFHAFYFISYTATTIGFGEIPAAFSEAQRMWATLTIYLSVVGWTYSILTILALFSDRAFQQALAAGRFERRVNGITEPFYLVCGCGETGAMLIHAMDRLDMRFVVVEIVESRIVELELEDFRGDAPALVADAGQTQVLLQAGLRHPRCRAVLALTDNDETNLAIAVAVRLLNPAIPVLCRAEHRNIAARMEAFGADYIVNPFVVFGHLLAKAVHAPASYRLHEWLIGTPGSRLKVSEDPPRGRWVICGFGRFGKSVAAQLAREGVTLTIIDPEVKSDPDYRVVTGSGFEEAVLREAGVDAADAFVAGADNDINNLSIAVAARKLNPKMFTVVRQNRRRHEVLFNSFDADLAVAPSEIVAHACLAQLTTPLLPLFLELAEHQQDEWAWALLARMRMIMGDQVPECWSIAINANDAAAVVDVLQHEEDGLPLEALLADPAAREIRLQCVPLLLNRDGDNHLAPGAGDTLRYGDRILFAGSHEARSRQALIMQNDNALTYIRTGREAHVGWLWGRLFPHRRHAHAR